MPTQPTPCFLPTGMCHVSNRIIHRESARAGTWAVACMAQRRRPADWAVRSPLARPLGRHAGYRCSTSPPPIVDVACGSLSALRLRIEFTTPRACSGCEPSIWGVRRARFGLSIPNGNVQRGRIEGGQGVRQWGVARDWQALRLLDKPTRAVPSNLVPFCLFSTLNQNQRPPGHEIPAQNGRAHWVPGVFSGGTSCLRT
jgi:hypothetical protein